MAEEPSSTRTVPTVAIVGRPNVGKSTLMNRILGRRVAIVEEQPGVTRDRKEVMAEWLGHEFLLIDTGGWMPRGTALDQKVSKQSEQAIAEADVLLFVVDAHAGITDEDARVADLLRSRAETVVLVANKVDDLSHEPLIWELMSLGLGEPFPISALHGRGAGDLLDKVISFFPELPDEPEVEEEPVEAITSVALVGRPNVGKSTLFNQLIGEDRSVVHDMAGTTRDSVDTVVETEFGKIKFVDTAGMRRKSKIDESTEYFSMVRALQSVDSANVAVLVIDATEGITHQDQRLAERVNASGCPIVVALNKWELLNAEQRDDVLYQLQQRLHFLGQSPILRISALSGRGVHRLMPALSESISQYQTRIPTRKVNEVVRTAQQAQPAPHGARILYATQGAADPPTFTLFVSKEIPASYLRYIERQLRDTFDLGQTPIKLRVRQR